MQLINFFHKLLSPKDPNKLVWKEFSDGNKGRFVKGSYDQSDLVEISYKNQKIIFDQHSIYKTVGAICYETKYTRVRMEFKSMDDLRFKLTNQGFITHVGKFFGSQDIEIGHNEFDNKFLIQGTDDYKIQTLFSNPTIQFLLLSQEDIRLHILDKEGVFEEAVEEGSLMLYYLSKTVVTQVHQLTDLLSLYQNIIDEMVEFNSIQRNN